MKNNNTLALVLFIAIPILPTLVISGVLGEIFMLIAGVIAYKIFTNTKMTQNKKIVLIIITFVVGALLGFLASCLLGILLVASNVSTLTSPSPYPIR